MNAPNKRIITAIPSDMNWLMSFAFLASTRSKDPRTKVGAALMMDDKSVFTGYNGCPSGFDDAILHEPNKNEFVIHAEDNALTFAGLERCRAQRQAVLCVTIKPCPHCLLKIAHYGINNIVYYSDYNSVVHDKDAEERIIQQCQRKNTYFAMFKYSDINKEPLLYEHEHFGIK